ncbi:urease subunit beta [Streptomyces sp. SID5914]|nr:urease subunit beta [Streptomyces sp. SID5914]
MSERQRRPGSGKSLVPGSGKGESTGLVQPGAESADEPGAPGQIIFGPGPVTINAGRPVISVSVVNTADRPVSVGSHYHFAEVNPALSFDRDRAWGHRLNILAGGMQRFDPGATVEVELVPLGGRRIVRGLRSACGGALDG